MRADGEGGAGYPGFHFLGVGSDASRTERNDERPTRNEVRGTPEGEHTHTSAFRRARVYLCFVERIQHVILAKTRASACFPPRSQPPVSTLVGFRNHRFIDELPITASS